MVKSAYLARWLMLALILALVAGCNPMDVRRNSHLEDSLLYYKIQMNRSNFAEAARFRNPKFRWDVQGLQRFQVTFYEVKSSHSSDNGNRIERQVFLRYLDRNTMRERSTLYTEIWVYNSESGQWLLEGDPPVLR
ncbi:MAG: hypothetical protein R3188_08090 [Acidiferrobacterales bacterium]|jgi:hypothetical protein|nr:hypothetical protein [Acidiferrobacterales bacterium]